MCLIVFAYKAHPQYKMILAANRDEFFNRPAEPADMRGEIICGLDKKAGGTWLGVHTSGKIAALTNYRDLRNIKQDAPSRGELVMNFLNSTLSPEEYFARTAESSDMYNGFNMIAFDKHSGAYFGSMGKICTPLEPGIYGLSNALLDTPWQKTETAKLHLTRLVNTDDINAEPLLNILQNKKQAEEKDLPDTGIGLEWEKVLSPIFINTKGYGTRCSTILLWGNADKIKFREVTYDESGAQTGDKQLEIQV